MTRTPDGGLWIERGALEGPLVTDGEGGFLAVWATRRPDRITFELAAEGPARSLSFDGFAMQRVEFGPAGGG